MQSVFSDPGARRAYLLTKLVLVVVTAGVTALLASRFGPRMWWAWAGFVAILAVLALPALLAPLLVSEGGAGSAPDDETGPADDDDDSPELADAVEVPIEDAIDLHPFPPKVIPDVVAAYLEAARERGYAEVRLIHGRGVGVQRERVRSLLAERPDVVDFHDAPPERGGWGATIAYLKAADDEERSPEE